MTATLKVDGPCRRTLSFSIERQQLDQRIEARLRDVASRTPIKGFRPGKAPLEVIRRSHGKEITEDARHGLISEALGDAVKEHDLHLVGDPELDPADIVDDGAGPISFDVKVEVAPDFELGDLSTLSVTVQVPAVDDTMVQRELDAFRQSQAQPEDAPEGAVIEESDLLEATVAYTVDGEALEPRTDRRVVVKQEVVDGVVIEGARDALLGKAVGDTVELDATLPEHFEPTALAGKSAHLAVTIDRHRRLADGVLDAETLKNAGVSSEDELREKIREHLDTQVKRVRDQQADRALEDRLRELVSFELPERMVETSIEKRVHEYAHRLMEQQKLGSEEGHQAAEAEREKIAEMVRAGLKASFIFARIAREKELGASPEEAEAHIRSLGAMSGQDGEELLKRAWSEGWIRDVVAQLTEEKTRSWLRENADIKEEELPAMPESESEGLAEA